MGILQVIRQRKDGTWTLTDETRDYIYPCLVIRDGENCNICKKPRSTKARLAIDHIDNVKPLKHELDGQIVLSCYQLLCFSCNTKKRREFEKNGLSNALSQDYQNTSNTRKTADLNGTRERERVWESENKHINQQNSEDSLKKKQKFYKAIDDILDQEEKMEKKELLSTAINIMYQQGENISDGTSEKYFKHVLVKKEYGGRYEIIEDIYVRKYLDD